MHDKRPKPRVAELKLNGVIYYRVPVGWDEKGNQNYKSFKRDKEAAEKFVETLKAREESKRRAVIENLTPQEQADVDWSLATISKYGHTVKDAVEWFEKTKFPEQGDKTVTEVGEIYLRDRKEQILESTYENYERKIEILSDWFGEKLINEITTKDLNEFFEEKKRINNWTANTENPWKKFAVFYFKWLQQRGYIHREGYTAADQLIIPKRDISTPKLAKPSEVAHYLFWLCGEAEKREKRQGKEIAENIRGCIVHLVLILFCGIRREEACKVVWKDINLEGEYIVVLKENSKTKRRRVPNMLEDNVWSWLRYCKNKGANLDGYSKKYNGKQEDPMRRLTYRQKKYRQSFEKAGKRVPNIVATEKRYTNGKESAPKAKYQNIMRHSFVSYHMKKYKSAGLTAGIAGNSEKQVEGTYLELVRSEKEAEAYFAINPPEFFGRGIQSSMTVDEAFERYKMQKHYLEHVDLCDLNAKKVAEIESELLAWEREHPDNIHKLAKKKEWYDSPESVTWDDDTDEPIVKEIDLDRVQEKKSKKGSFYFMSKESIDKLKKQFPDKIIDSDKPKDTD
jgi:site-specific recombinase XerD